MKIFLFTTVVLLIIFSGCTEKKNGFECTSDKDCVPAQCCHPRSCVPLDKAPKCLAVLCTYQCASGTLDCGQGSCICVNGKCQVEWLNIPEEKYCETNDDCAIQSTDDCCGREAVNKHYSQDLYQVCEMICPEYTTECENNICVLVKN